MLRKAFEKIKKKLAGRRGNVGETLVEVLVAMTVAGLAMIMLAMAIAVSSRIVTQSAHAADTYYEESDNMAAPTSGSATLTVKSTGFGELPGVTTDTTVNSLNYYLYEDMPGGGSGVSYEATTLTQAS